MGTSAGERRSLPFRRQSVIQLSRVSTAPQSKPTSYTEWTNSGSARALLSFKKRTAPTRPIRDAGPESASSLLVEKYSSLVGKPFAREESARAAQRWEEEASMKEKRRRCGWAQKTRGRERETKTVHFEFCGPWACFLSFSVVHYSTPLWPTGLNFMCVCG